MRTPPWNPVPKPVPVTMAPMKNTATEPCAMPASVMDTPTNSAPAPSSIIRRGSRWRSSKTAAVPLPASVNSVSPPSTDELDPSRLRTTAGPSEP